MSERLSKLMKWIRYKIAVLYDRRPDTCWSELVNFAENATFAEWSDFLNKQYGRIWSQGCRKWRKDTPYAYCGKCEKTGRYYLEPDQEKMRP